MTTMGVLLIKAEARAAKPSNSVTANFGCVLALLSAKRVTRSSDPVRTNAPMTMNMAAIVQGAGFDRTAKPSL